DELYFGPPPAGVTGVDLWHAARDIAAATRGAMSPQAGRFARPGGLPRVRSANASSSAGVIYVNRAGEGISSSVLAKQGSSRLAGNFQGLNGGSFEEIVSRVPSDWTWAPQRGGNGIRFFDTAGKERIRIHGPNPKAPPGSNSRNGWVLRVTDRVGNFYDELGRIQPDKLTNEGHIPIWGNPNAR
ncbi:MAG: polymorphic toxin type 30 domain-containing protein, partial [Planctomycetia bacterium]